MALIWKKQKQKQKTALSTQWPSCKNILLGFCQCHSILVKYGPVWVMSQSYMNL